MSQNTSSAVMQQRHEALDSLDDFATPCWATRAALKYILPGFWKRSHTVWEPACNRGFMVRPLREAFDIVHGTDIFDYGVPGFGTADFLMPTTFAKPPFDLIFSNPPFRLADQFIAKAREQASLGYAMFVRTAFTEGQDRYKTIFRDNPPTVIAYFAERVILHKGPPRDPDVAYFDETTGTMKRPSTATAYIWAVWIKGEDRQPPIWIPPTRHALTLPGDYDL